MEKYPYVIVGGGMAADAAAGGIREIDSEGEILLISSENQPPYNRPPLSKALWKGMDIESIWRKTGEKKVKIELDTVVTHLDTSKKEIQIATGEKIGFEKLLLATGGSPRTLPFEDDKIIYYRYLDDYKKLHNLSQRKDYFAVIGSGFIGSEIAAALAMNGQRVILFDIGPGVGWNIFPRGLTKFLNEYFREKGVTILPNVTVEKVSSIANEIEISLKDGNKIKSEAVVAGVGIQPNTSLAKTAGLSVSDGVEVNKHLQTSVEIVFAAGDVANFYNPLLDKRIRVEHSNNAVSMGKQAGRNMAGAEESYDYLPFFYSDLFDLGYEAVGELDSRSEIVEDWQEEYQKGVLYYLADGKVRGVLLWNVWDKLDQAREVIAHPAPVNKSMLKGRIQ